MFEQYERESRRAESVRSLGARLQLTRFGLGALHEVGHVSQLLGIRRALLVVDPRLVATEGAKLLETVLRRAGIVTSAFTQISATPLAAQAEAAAARRLDVKADGVISYGGGSSIDVGKAASFLQKGKTIFDYGHGRTPEVRVPHIAIPTTAGTGAESSSYAFFVQGQGHEHTVVMGDALVPAGAIIDPLTHVTMPPPLTAASGINALADAIEAVLGPTSTEASDAHAAHAIEAIFQALPAAVSDGHDLEARSAMALAAYEAGQAFRIAGLGLVDSISLVLSSYNSIGQSRANSLVLPHVMAYQAERSPKRMARLAGLIPGASDGATAIQAVKDLIHNVGIRGSLHDVGLGWDDVYLASHAILRHPFNERDPEGLTAEALAEVLAAALEVQG